MRLNLCTNCKKPHAEDTKWCPDCKLERRTSQRAWNQQRLSDPELKGLVHARSKAYREANRARILESKRRSYHKNKETPEAKALRKSLSYAENRVYDKLVRLLFS